MRRTIVDGGARSLRSDQTRVPISKLTEEKSKRRIRTALSRHVPCFRSHEHKVLDLATDQESAGIGGDFI